jgi:predicted GTPase
MLDSSRPVISVCSVRTGAGKSGVTRYIARLLKELGKRPVVLRHPMPYLDLREGRLQRFGSMADARACHCTIEELEEFEPLVNAGIVVYAGSITERSSGRPKKRPISLMDGGNNDLPFLRAEPRNRGF